jgi:RecB family exonuclease
VASARLFWRARLARVAERFLADEQRRRALATPAALEVKGRLDFPEIGFTLTAKADRIDRNASGEYLIYDYKTGSPPTAPQVERFEKQLLLEAVMAEGGAFEGLAPAPVASVAYIGLGASPKTVEIPLDKARIARIRDEFLRLIRHYQRPAQGYTARRVVARTIFAGDYDHLARYGEWDETHEPRSEEVGHGPR